MSAEPDDLAAYQPLDPGRAAIPQRPLCAASSIERCNPGRHRVGPLPILLLIGPKRYPLCSMACLELLAHDWRARRAARAALAHLDGVKTSTGGAW